MARRYLEVSYLTLQKWGHGCPWLEGEGIETRRFTGPLSRTLTYYAKTDLDLIRKAKANRRPVPEYPGQVYLADAIAESGGHRFGLRKARPTGPILRPGKDKLGRSTLRSYVPRTVVDRFRAERTPALGPDDITVAQAKEVLRCDRSWVKNLVRQGILHAKHGRIPWKGKYSRRGGLLLSKREVEAYRQEQAGQSRAPRLDDAVARLRSILADGQKHLSRDVKKQLMDQGVSLTMVIKAAQKLKVRMKAIPRGKPSLWWLPGQNAAKGAPIEKSKRGRPIPPKVGQMHEFFYRELKVQKSKTRKTILREARERWGNIAPREITDVTRYARRHANRHGLPWE